MPNISRI